MIVPPWLIGKILRYSSYLSKEKFHTILNGCFYVLYRKRPSFEYSNCNADIRFSIIPFTSAQKQLILFWNIVRKQTHTHMHCLTDTCSVFCRSESLEAGAIVGTDFVDTPHSLSVAGHLPVRQTHTAFVNVCELKQHRNARAHTYVTVKHSVGKMLGIRWSLQICTKKARHCNVVTVVTRECCHRGNSLIVLYWFGVIDYNCFGTSVWMLTTQIQIHNNYQW